MIATALALLLGAADPCAPVRAPSTSDPAAAALYREAGDAEAARGAPAVAAVAYRKAASLDANDQASRSALRGICRELAGGEDAFAAGKDHLERGDFRAAAQAFDRARLAGDRSAALLEGVSQYRLGDDGAAEASLREAEQAPEHREMALLYLGLLSLRAGQPVRAAELFDSAASDASLATMAGNLARLARRDGRLVLSVALQSGLDSNVTLAPRSSGSTSGGSGGMMGGSTGLGGFMGSGDGLYDIAAGALWRPTGPEGPYLRASGALHRYFRQDGYDLATLDATGGWQLAGEGKGLLGEVGYRGQRFGSSPYLQSGRAAATGWLSTGNLTWSATWSGALQRYATAFDAFSGTLQRLEGRAAWTFGSQSWLALAYGTTWNAARTSIASTFDHGPRLELRVVVGPRHRAGLDAAISWRRYGAFDSALGAREATTFLDGSVFVEMDLADRWTARLAIDGRTTNSNVAASGYTRVVPVAGLVYVFGM